MGGIGEFVEVWRKVRTGRGGGVDGRRNRVGAWMVRGGVREVGWR